MNASSDDELRRIADAEKRFPDQASAPAQTDPELIGVFENLAVGNDLARLLDVLTQLIPFIGYPLTLNGLRVLDDVRA
jgi:hypothetical protein